ncbi:MAG: N-succinylarginine dihydrolase [Sphingomonadales bacterium]
MGTSIKCSSISGAFSCNQPIADAEFLDVRQSMRNGGGPACLRLRIVLTEKERAAVGANVIMNDALYRDLTAWVEKHYRDRVVPDDLADPDFCQENLTAVDTLTGILKLGSVFEFQR